MDTTITAAQHTNPAEASADQKRLAQLAEIRRTADWLSMSGPRTRQALRWALLAFVIAECALYGYHTLLGSMRFLFEIVSFPLAYVTFKLVYRFSTKPTSYAAVVYGLLCKYDPMNKAAYLFLQNEIRNNGALSSDNVEFWLAAESEAIPGYVPVQKMMPGKAAFLSKKI